MCVLKTRASHVVMHTGMAVSMATLSQLDSELMSRSNSRTFCWNNLSNVVSDIILRKINKNDHYRHLYFLIGRLHSPQVTAFSVFCTNVTYPARQIIDSTVSSYGPTLTEPAIHISMENYPRRKTSYAHSTLGAGMNGLESTVHLLGYELHVASLGKSSLPAATHTLVRLLLRLFGRGPECRK